MSKALEALTSIKNKHLHVNDIKKRNIATKMIQTDISSIQYLELVEKAYLYDINMSVNAISAIRDENRVTEKFDTFDFQTLKKAESMPSIESIDKAFFDHYDSDFGRSRILTCPPLSNGGSEWSESIFESLYANDKPRGRLNNKLFSN